MRKSRKTGLTTVEINTGQLITRGLDFPWTQTYKIPTANRPGTIGLMNHLAQGQRGRWICNVPCVRGFQIQQFDYMHDENWVHLVVRDCIAGVDVPVVVPAYTVFGFTLEQKR